MRLVLLGMGAAIGLSMSAAGAIAGLILLVDAVDKEMDMTGLGGGLFKDRGYDVAEAA